MAWRCPPARTHARTQAHLAVSHSAASEAAATTTTATEVSGTKVSATEIATTATKVATTTTTTTEAAAATTEVATATEPATAATESATAAAGRGWQSLRALTVFPQENGAAVQVEVLQGGDRSVSIGGCLEFHQPVVGRSSEPQEAVVTSIPGQERGESGVADSTTKHDKTYQNVRIPWKKPSYPQHVLHVLVAARSAKCHVQTQEASNEIQPFQHQPLPKRKHCKRTVGPD